MIDTFVGYIQAKSFGNYYLPVRFQNKLIKEYSESKKKIFTLPQGEPYFSKTHIRLRTMLSKIKKNEALVLMSIFMLPENLVVRNPILNLIKKKNIEVHFLFENKKIIGGKNIDIIREFFFYNSFFKSNKK